MHCLTKSTAIGLFCILPASSPCLGQWTEQARLTASDWSLSDEFGGEVAIDGTTLIAGAYRGDAGPSANTGSAYIFNVDGNGWNETAALVGLDSQLNDQFGYSVDLSGSHAIVGSPVHSNTPTNDQSGAAYVFTRVGSAWSQSAKLIGDPLASTAFGVSVALDGDTAVVGASGQGAAYVFQNSGGTWTQKAKLNGDFNSILFGGSVAISGDTAIVSARDNDSGSNSGAVYLFERDHGGLNNWGRVARITASDGTANALFGSDVSISGDTAVVGSSGTNSAYLLGFTGSEWVETDILVPDSFIAVNSLFGSSVSVDGDRIVVGAPLDTFYWSAAGSAYVFEYQGDDWLQVAVLNATAPAAGDRLGDAVAVNGNLVIAGAMDDDNHAGSVYVFTPEPGALAGFIAMFALSLNRRHRDFTH